MADDRIAALENRLKHLEDVQEIQRLLASYAPLVDAGRSEEVAALFEPEAVFDNDEVQLFGQEQIRTMVLSDRHQEWIKGGACHFNGPVRVTVDGDTAVAVGHSLMVVRRDGQFVVRRATANHWQLRRTSEGWRIEVRTTNLLDGREASRELLAAGALGQPVRTS